MVDVLRLIKTIMAFKRYNSQLQHSLNNLYINYFYNDFFFL